MNLFATGEIVKTRGLHGCLKILCYVEKENSFAQLKFIYIEESSGEKNRFNLRKISLSGKCYLSNWKAYRMWNRRRS